MGIKLGQRIKDERKKIKMSSAKLSELAGISKSFLDYIEIGAREPKPENVVKIAIALNISPEALLDTNMEEALTAALDKLRVEGTSASAADVKAIARGSVSENLGDASALSMVVESFRSNKSPERLAEYIENPDLKAILKVGAKLNDEDLEKLRKIMEAMYPDEFQQ